MVHTCYFISTNFLFVLANSIPCFNLVNQQQSNQWNELIANQSQIHLMEKLPSLDHKHNQHALYQKLLQMHHLEITLNVTTNLISLNLHLIFLNMCTLIIMISNNEYYEIHEKIELNPHSYAPCFLVHIITITFPKYSIPQLYSTNQMLFLLFLSFQ